MSGGVWKKDSVKDVAESVGISNLSDEVATALAGDVEYRLWEVIEESMKFMRHAKRTRLKVDDVNHALRMRNYEPLWGFGTTSHLPFRRTVTPTGVVYYVEDEEIDLGKAIKSELPSVPRDVSFTAHWLAIEGVQPLIKENPSPAGKSSVSVPKRTSIDAFLDAELARYAKQTGPITSSTQDASGTTITPLVKHVLSRELQLYFTRLTEALIGGEQEMRDAALGSVRSDPGLHQLVPYLIGWGGEQASRPAIANHLDNLQALERALDLFHAMLENSTLFIEPYLHQLTPPVLTCLLTSSLPPGTPNAYPSPLQIRTSASSLLHLLLSRHSASYPSLKPRITKTLLRGLGGDNRGLGARWGAARGLSGIVGGSGGNRAVREWVGAGLKTLGELIEREDEAEPGERNEVVREILTVLKSSLLDAERVKDDSEAEPPLEDLTERYGLLFAQAIAEQWDRGGRDIWRQVPGSTGSTSAEKARDAAADE
ncbi:histone H4-like TAF Taf6, SAGA complex subunit [Microbotryomycetes sp. JL201]|nr:histone H4-like TAF Taf6, SAGA complex subunit [Microbotryomycetes sp. JL201]